MQAELDSTLKTTSAILRLVREAQIDPSQRVAAIEAARVICEADSEIVQGFKENVDYSAPSL